ncbi:VanZ family protein [Candidatus Gottesmanbacteria bacterium]|nr:VanZ family protein [Candidatus Gottesmanbacteria bacterium]
MKKLNYWFPSIVIALTIFILSSRQRISVSDEFFINFAFFKSLHVVEYGIFCFFNYRAILNTVTNDKKKAGIISLAITILYAATDEYHQTLVPTRTGKPKDLIFDTMGAVISIIFIWKLLPNLPKQLLKLGKKLEVV